TFCLAVKYKRGHHHQTHCGHHEETVPEALRTELCHHCGVSVSEALTKALVEKIRLLDPNPADSRQSLQPLFHSLLSACSFQFSKCGHGPCEGPPPRIRADSSFRII